ALPPLDRPLRTDSLLARRRRHAYGGTAGPGGLPIAYGCSRGTRIFTLSQPGIADVRARFAAWPRSWAFGRNRRRGASCSERDLEVMVHDRRDDRQLAPAPHR